jgi:hypothetical protein
MSQLTKNQTKTFRADYYVDEKPETLVATVRYDDQCGNGHNTFSITGHIYQPYRQPGEPHVEHKDGSILWLNGYGCVHEAIAEHLPQLAPYIKWHLCSGDGPMNYTADTVHLAGDRDCWGLRKGEFHQFTDKASGLPIWQLSLDGVPGERRIAGKPQTVSATEPPPMTLRWKPYGRTGEGKERELDAARRAAIWPEATDEELTAPDLKTRLAARLPALMAAFRVAVEELGFTY